MQKGFSTILIILLVFLGMAGYIWLKSTANDELSNLTASEKVGCHPKLEQRLCKLIDSANQEKFSKENGLELEEDMVRVVIELAETAYILPEENGVEETRNSKGSLLQAKVKIDKLIETAASPAIRNIRPPQKATTL